jgi:hypothetical protein
MSLGEIRRRWLVGAPNDPIALYDVEVMSFARTADPD